MAPNYTIFHKQINGTTPTHYQSWQQTEILIFSVMKLNTDKQSRANLTQTRIKHTLHHMKNKTQLLKT